MAITLAGLPRTVAVSVTPGGAAGDHTIDGDLDASGDVLLSVRHVSDDFVTNADLTAEFTVAGHNLINNDLGTVTTGDFLVVTYAKASAS